MCYVFISTSFLILTKLKKNHYCSLKSIVISSGHISVYLREKIMISQNNNPYISLKAFKNKAYIDVLIGKEIRRKRYRVQSKRNREHREERNH